MGVFEKEGRSKVPVLHLMGEEYPLYVASPEILLRSVTRVDQIGDGRRYLWIARIAFKSVGLRPTTKPNTVCSKSCV